MNQIIKFMKSLIKRKPKQTTFCYCPKCNNELISSGSFVHDGGCLVDYHCSQCGYDSVWWFDIPVPVLLEPPNA